MNTVQIKKIPSNVTLSVADDPFFLPESLQQSIDSYWAALHSEGKEFLRGEVYSIKRMSETENELQVTLHKTDYAHFLYSKNRNIPDSYKCRVIVANGVLVTKDNVFMLGEMNDWTSTPGRIQFVAGGIDEQDIHSSRIDISATLKREVGEEVGIDLDDPDVVSNIEPRYIVNWGNIALVYIIRLQIASVEFMSRYENFEQSLKEKGMNPEFASIVQLPADRESVAEFLRRDRRPRSDFLKAVLEKETGLS
ncbi:NUDIX hydrolase [Rossellomorea sp. NPDC077527]|uniref:NUDIX hydrolase n=1 Tax=Rossellomorea sp. NPDC077527 TaxID=3364510 RepID=UPI0037C9DE8F